MIRAEAEWDLGLKFENGRVGFYADIVNAKQGTFELCDSVGLFETEDKEKEFFEMIEDGLIQFNEVDNLW